jgi:hypothetical protein
MSLRAAGVLAAGRAFVFAQAAPSFEMTRGSGH